MRLPVRRPPHPAHLVPAATSRKALRPSRRQDGEDYGARATYGGDRSMVSGDCGAGSGSWQICLRGLGMKSQQIAATWSPLVIPAEAKRRAGTGRDGTTFLNRRFRSDRRAEPEDGKGLAVFSNPHK